MSTELRVYTGEGKLQGQGLSDISTYQPSPLYTPISYPDLATAIDALDAPADANYVYWPNGATSMETVMASLSANDILVLPEREEPYLIDSSNGFMASGVSGVDGTGPDGLKDGSIVPIVSNPRLWFEMTRVRRGIIGLGPGAVILPSNSGWTAPRQPILPNEPEGQKFQRLYFTAGGTQNISGTQETLIGYSHSSPFFANFTIRGRDFGGVAYNSIKRTGGTGTMATLKRIHFDQSWRSHAGVPNGEAGAMTFHGGQYLVENCDLVMPSEGYTGGSPMMWNNNTGGTVRHVRSSGTKGGMWTFWRSSGVNVFENVSLLAAQTGMNLEENLSGFELDWTGGSMEVGLGFAGNKFHFGINPSGGPPRISLSDVTISTNAYTAGALTLNIYTTYGVAKRSWVTCNTYPVSCVPGAAWVE